MVLEGEDHRVVWSLEWRGGNSFHCVLKTNGRTCKLSHFDGRIWQFHYLEEYFCAHGFSVSENDLIVILSLSVPTIQLDTTRSGQQDLEKERHANTNGPKFVNEGLGTHMFPKINWDTLVNIPDDRFQPKTSLRTAFRSGTCCGWSWCSSDSEVGPCPKKVKPDFEAVVLCER